jgi:hypothetical protein
MSSSSYITMESKLQSVEVILAIDQLLRLMKKLVENHQSQCRSICPFSKNISREDGKKTWVWPVGE